MADYLMTDRVKESFAAKEFTDELREEMVDDLTATQWPWGDDGSHVESAVSGATKVINTLWSEMNARLVNYEESGGWEVSVCLYGDFFVDLDFEAMVWDAYHFGGIDDRKSLKAFLRKMVRKFDNYESNRNAERKMRRGEGSVPVCPTFVDRLAA